MEEDDNVSLAVKIADGCCLTMYSLILCFEVVIIARYLIPLRIKSFYILTFYVLLAILLISSMVEVIYRLAFDDPGYLIGEDRPMTFGEISMHIAGFSYVLLGFALSITMFQLSCSLALILNMIDLKEANRRRCTYNWAVIVIASFYVFCSVIEIRLDEQMHQEHLMFEVLGLIVLCLIYFSTCMDLLRKLRVFVLEETKKEARLVTLQFIIFFIAYGSKVITLLYWVKNPPHERKDVAHFLLNVDVMTIIWVLIPVIFVLWMQTRTFIKMQQETNDQSVLIGTKSTVKTDKTIESGKSTNVTLLNKTEIESSFISPDKTGK